MKEDKKLEVVSGDGSNLNISPVYEHINVEKSDRSNQKPKNIVIPKIKSKDNKKDNK